MVHDFTVNNIVWYIFNDINTGSNSKLYWGVFCIRVFCIGAKKKCLDSNFLVLLYSGCNVPNQVESCQWFFYWVIQNCKQVLGNAYLRNNTTNNANKVAVKH